MGEKNIYILAWDINPILSYTWYCIQAVKRGQNIVCNGTHTQSSSDVIVMSVMSSCNIASQHIQELLGAYFEFNGDQEKEFIICVMLG